MDTINGIIATKESGGILPARSGQLTYSDRSFTVEYEGRVQRLAVQVDICGSFHGAERYRTDAVWDTGSAVSCISETLARKIRLQPVDDKIVITASGKVKAMCYIADIHLPGDIVIEGMKIEGFPPGQHDVDFLIGMDIITRGELRIRGWGGKTEVEFRMN